MRGRRPSGPEFVDKLPGGEKAKARLKILLETIAGERRVLDACERLAISEPRFDQLRLIALQAAIVALEDRPAGRPARQPNAAEEEIAQLRGRIAELEADIGVPALQQMFPHLARAAIEDLVRRYRRVWRRRHKQPIHVLHWTRPGAVWALDFHGPRAGIDGVFPYLLAVRDLASGQQLLWQPIADMTADTARSAFRSLVAQHGAPLVLKSDNGSAFIAGEFAREIAGFDVRILYSPPRTPKYNGAIEAAIGSLTSRTEQHATRGGHPGHWTWDDVEAARLQANATSRPHDAKGSCPDELWANRTAITDGERRSFDELVQRKIEGLQAAQELEQRQGSATDNSDRVAPDDRATQRKAIRSALVEQGILYYSRKRIPLPIPRKKTAIIS